MLASHPHGRRVFFKVQNVSRPVSFVEQHLAAVKPFVDGVEEGVVFVGGLLRYFLLQPDDFGIGLLALGHVFPGVHQLVVVERSVGDGKPHLLPAEIGFPQVAVAPAGFQHFAQLRQLETAVFAVFAEAPAGEVFAQHLPAGPVDVVVGEVHNVARLVAHRPVHGYANAGRVDDVLQQGFALAQLLLQTFIGGNVVGGGRHPVAQLHGRLQKPAVELLVHVVPLAPVGHARFEHLPEGVENAFRDDAGVELA